MSENYTAEEFDELDDLQVIESSELKVGGAFHAFRFKSLVEATPED
ncbi:MULTISPECIES: hypothetical protein [Streptomyces]|uniref:Uncharacterized protein n=1 Tax=Streptomyces morookaense TaxID=1970 RepID=A0A7Y7B8N8_STRMO|nr:MULTISPECIES: hypothetical protein [Streptomyces]MCC2279047.1 hypothetical protein [Streptomyces sp. ET3-23]NVK81082.1 hypothetical protein [Streptomyces morookaense]GHF14761.1 hypothetical protein GCM10010359_15080 [Streptomyces morookaense]